MTLWVVVVCGLVGWWPRGPKPVPEPPIPLVGQFKDAILGFVGGVGGGFLVHFALSLSGPLASDDFLAVALGAAVVGRILQVIGEMVWSTP